jgi:aminotransferase
MIFSKRISKCPRSGIRQIFDLAQKMGDVVSLGIGEPDFETPKQIKDAAKEALDNNFTHYTSNSGILELREAIAEKLKKENGIYADPRKEIMVTVGSTQAIFLLLSAVINDGDEALIPSPAFVVYAPATSMAGGKPIEVPMVEEEGYKIDIEGLKKKISRKSKLIILNSPCNPTGSVLTKKNIEQIAGLAIEHNIHILSDEVYEKYVYEGEHFSPASLNGVGGLVTTVNGFSKTYAMTGWRIGYIIARHDIIEELNKIQMYNAVCPVSFIQKAAIEALVGRQDFIRDVVRGYDARRRFICGEIKKMTDVQLTEPKGAFYVFPRVVHMSNSNKFCKELLVKAKVAVVPGCAFGKAGEGHFRISYSTNMRNLQEASMRLADFLRNRR